MVGAFSNASRPERVNRNANEFYNANEADRYTSTSNIIQKELTYKALELLGVQKGDFYYVADIGCGSGLSSRILYLEGLPWAGTDISLDMLSIAQTQQQENEKKDGGGKKKTTTEKNLNTTAVSLCKGRLTASDMSQGLPFRNEAFDLAISISAVQWLCYNKTPKEAAERFFTSVWRCLETPSDTGGGNCVGRAAFQVYLENDDHKKILLEAATSAGFLASYFMDYPHRTPAKKFYILLSKSHTTDNSNCKVKAEEEKQDLTFEAVDHQKAFSRCCNLAWPARSTCSLPWLTWREGNNSSTARACTPRVVQEHASVGKRVLRLLRHASSCGSALQPPTLLQPVFNSSEDGGSNRNNINTKESGIVLEIAVPHENFMPCGGPCMLQLSVSKGLLQNLHFSSSGSYGLLKNRNLRKRDRESDDDEKNGEEEKEEARREEKDQEKETSTNGGDGEDASTKIIHKDKNFEDLISDPSNQTTGLSSSMRNLVHHLLGCSEIESNEAFYYTNPKSTSIKNGSGGGGNTSEQPKTGQQKKQEEGEEKVEERKELVGSSWPEHLQQARQLELQQSDNKQISAKTPFFYLEHIAGNSREELSNSNNIAILHATKPPLPEILVLASDHTHSSICGDGSSGSLESVQKQLAILCKDRNASVIGVDMLVHSLENVSCAWLMYVPQLQTTDRTAVWEQWGRWREHPEQQASAME